MKAKRIPAVLFLVVLLVMSMASTAFAGTVTTTGNCGTFIEQQAQYGAGSLPDSVEIKMVVVPVVADPQNKTCEVSREPDVEEPQEPVVEEPQQPAEEEPRDRLWKSRNSLQRKSPRDRLWKSRSSQQWKSPRGRWISLHRMMKSRTLRRAKRSEPFGLNAMERK